MKYINRSSVCIWGWGYSGYLVNGMLVEDSHAGEDRLIKCGIAVSPVTSLHLYGMYLAILTYFYAFYSMLF